MRVVGKGIHDQIGYQCDYEQVCQHEGESGEGKCQALSKLYLGIIKLWETLFTLKDCLMNGIVKNAF
jgi:hypothetical protein